MFGLLGFHTVPAMSFRMYTPYTSRILCIQYKRYRLKAMDNCEGKESCEECAKARPRMPQGQFTNIFVSGMFGKIFVFVKVVQRRVLQNNMAASDSGFYDFFFNSAEGRSICFRFRSSVRMSVCMSVCLSVCEQPHAKSIVWIFMKFLPSVPYQKRKSEFYFE